MVAEHTLSYSPASVGRRYCLITPCRDEAAFARRTLDSVAKQTVAPALWVVVDDGSKDDTPAIVEEYAARLPYIRLLRRVDRGHRKVGAGVIEAFNEGLASIDLRDFDYICKFDMDLELPPVTSKVSCKGWRPNRVWAPRPASPGSFIPALGRSCQRSAATRCRSA